MCFFKFKKRKIDLENKNYEQILLKQYGYCKPINKSINILVFSDTHNSYAYNTEELEKIKELNYDICLLLGDHSLTDIQEILKFVPIDKIYGLRGNHDKLDDLAYCNIKNLHATSIEVNGIKIGGIQGSSKYKNSPTTAPIYTQEQSLEISKNLNDLDIIISHDTYYFGEVEDISHQGMKGITEAIYRNNCPIHIHGHLHSNEDRTMLNNTISYGVYGYRLIKI
ncbi:MAG: metallophosphoesterase family protein [Clostridia bacterium]|nr:metallophosphoesterase family protein [Clostridia bacterium]